MFFFCNIQLRLNDTGEGSFALRRTIREIAKNAMKLASKLAVGKYGFLKYLDDFVILYNIISATLYNLLYTIKIFLATCSVIGAGTTGCRTLI